MTKNFKAQQAIMKELFDHDQLLNCRVITEDGGVFKIHMEYLVGMSSYFRRAVISAKGTPLESILIPSISKEVMFNIINFIYTGQLVISMDKVSDLVKAGEMLGMIYIIKLCRKYIIENLNEEHCLKIYTSSDYLQIPDIKDEVKHYILNHFQQIFPVSDDYVNLDIDDLVAILSSDNLNITEEDYVFWAIMRWIENDPVSRLKHLPDLLRCIRFGLCNPQFYEYNILNHPYIRNSEECLAITLQASQLFRDMPPSTGNQLSISFLNMNHPFLRPRTPTEIIFVMGGWSQGSATNLIETFDIKCGRWFLAHTTDSIPRAYHGMLWHKGCIYVIGGFDGHQSFNDVRRFNPTSHVWEEKGCMNVPRCYVSVAALGNFIYAMGGYDGVGERRHKSCERYDPERNQWTMMADMNYVRSDAGADTLNGKIYIAGGFNGRHIVISAECYDPETNTWTSITSMTSPRSGLKLATYNGYLFIIGGFNGNQRLQMVEKYDPITRRWSPVPNMNGPRSNFATTVMYDCLYVIGGFNGHGTISLAERYDHRKDVWIPIPELNLNRSALAACTVKDIPNANEYTFLGNDLYF